MKRTRNLLVGAALVAVLVALGLGQARLDRSVAAQGAQAPKFEVDPMWPKPLPNHWVLGSTIGIDVDERDHVWIIHRGSATLGNNEKGLELKPPTGECCAAAPPVLEFDAEGNLVGHWGGPGQGYEWPSSNHGITVDDKGNVWIGGNGAGDSHILKFSRDGKFLQQIGKANVRKTGETPGKDGQPAQAQYTGNSSDPNNFGRVAEVSYIDLKTNEAFVADGYLNKRVAVIDATTGAMKRFWGAYGNKPDDANLGRYDPNAPLVQQFRNPVHCAEVTNDGMVYVCDRPNNRIQVFTRDGKFVKEVQILKNSLGEGSVWDIAFSRDAQQRYLYLADGRNMRVHILDRNSLQELTSFGDGGRQPGQFYAVHSIATDSKGNIYTTETYEGKRLQKFVFKGMAPVSRPNQGTVWPARTTN
jgi:DNA-binding beta-propeller fold protein YncE